MKKICGFEKAIYRVLVNYLYYSQGKETPLIIYQQKGNYCDHPEKLRKALKVLRCVFKADIFEMDRAVLRTIARLDNDLANTPLDVLRKR